MRDSCIFYRSFFEAIDELPPENQAELYKAIFEYSLNFNQLELSGLSKTVFTLIKPQLDANLKRFKNGSKAKEKQKGSKKEAKPKQEESKPEANNNNNNNNNLNENVNNNPNENLGPEVNEKEKQFIDPFLRKYKIIEGTNPRLYIDNFKMIFDYMYTELKSEDERKEFRKQISFYHKYKKVADEKLHSLSNLVAKGWKECNYEAKYKSALNTAQNGKNNTRKDSTPPGQNYKDPNYDPAVKW